MKVLVTGAGGFLGQYIVEQLVSRGDSVRAFVRREITLLRDLGVECVRGDLRSAESVATACRGIDIVMHVAAVASIWGPWKHFYDINVIGTRNVLLGCQTHGVSGLVFTSSPSVTFAGSHQSGIDESAPYPDRWLCHYPHTKAIAEQEVLQADKPSGLRTCALRPHLIWGPRDQHLIPRLIERARRGQLRRVGDGRNRVDMIYVENAALAHLQAADRLVSAPERVGGRAYFLSQGEPVRCWDWINELLELHQLPPVTKSISLRAAWGLGLCLETVHRCLRLSAEPRMTRFLASQLACDHFFDISRAQRDFGYQPRISSAEGMRRLAACQGPQK